MRNYFPFVIDIDLKYNSVLEERQYNNDTIESLLEYLWSKITEYINKFSSKIVKQLFLPFVK